MLKPRANAERSDALERKLDGSLLLPTTASKVLT